MPCLSNEYYSHMQMSHASSAATLMMILVTLHLTLNVCESPEP